MENGGSKNTFNVDDVGYASAAAAGLDGGTITPTGASVGTKQGFSIIQLQILPVILLNLMVLHKNQISSCGRKQNWHQSLVQSIIQA